MCNQISFRCIVNIRGFMEIKYWKVILSFFLSAQTLTHTLTDIFIVMFYWLVVFLLWSSFLFIYIYMNHSQHCALLSPVSENICSPLNSVFNAVWMFHRENKSIFSFRLAFHDRNLKQTPNPTTTTGKIIRKKILKWKKI